jgi:LysR family hydrogen peroxide-inducible transcriptional activator
MRPSLRQLEYVVALAEHLSFKRAAAACHVSQPALSTQLRRLETLLGVDLFERSRQGVHLTPVGRAFARTARDVLGEIEALLETCRADAEPLTGDLHLGVIPTIAPYLLPRVMPHLRNTFPRLRILLREEQTEPLLHLLDRGEQDLLLLALDVHAVGAKKKQSLTTMELFKDTFLVGLPSGHRLAVQDEVSEGDLEHEQVLLLEDGHCLREQTLPICQRSGATEIVDVRASTLGTLVEMVSAGLGVTLLPELYREADRGKEARVQLRPFERSKFRRTIGLAWRRANPRGVDFERLGEELLVGVPESCWVVRGKRATGKRRVRSG